MIGSLLARFWPYAALAGLVLLTVFLGRRIGVLTAALKRVEAQIDLNERMRDAVANTSTDKHDVAERMRNGDW
jgi:uncharacterized small protein (DUF1192 family)